MFAYETRVTADNTIKSLAGVVSTLQDRLAIVQEIHNQIVPVAEMDYED